MTGEQPIMNSLIAVLNNSTSVTSSVSTRIYDSMAPQDPTEPFVVVTIAADVPMLFFDGNDDLGPLEFQVDVFGKVESGISTVRTIGDSVYASLHRQTITASGYTGMQILCTNRGSSFDQDLIVGGRTQQDAWRQTQLYKLFGTGS